MKRIFSEGIVLIYSKLLQPTPVAIDHNSGGYPYPAMSVSEIKIWKNESEALDYAKHFPREAFKLANITVEISDGSEYGKVDNAVIYCK